MKAEPVDPLAMDMGDEEVEYKPDRISDEANNLLLVIELCKQTNVNFIGGSALGFSR